MKKEDLKKISEIEKNGKEIDKLLKPKLVGGKK